VKQPPPVSIIIPTLEEGKYIARSLCQFTDTLRKTFNLEIIVSDGGSKDETVEIAKAFACTLLEHPSDKKQNISLGRNIGAAAAKGEILIFLNADVIIEDPVKFLRIMIEKASDRRNSAATCNVNIYREDERILDWMFHNFFNGYFWLLNILGMGMGRGECHVMRREVFESAGGYNEAIAAGEDYEFFMRLRRFGTVRFVRELTVFESPRRFRKYGYLRISMLWFLNALSVLLLRHSMVDDWKPVR
jgi:glycosyltransferase involved in cell wall biosynthesis